MNNYALLSHQNGPKFQLIDHFLQQNRSSAMCGMPGMSGNSMPMGMSKFDASAGVNGTTMSFSMSAMSPFFSPWGSYQLQLLFSTWNITEPWQFALSWIAVALTAVVYQCLECVYHALEHGMLELVHEKSQRMQILLENGENSYTSTSSSYVYRPRGWQVVKLTLAFVSALRYTLGLMLMLGMITNLIVSILLS